MSLAYIAPASAFTTVDATAVVPVGTIARDDATGNEYIYANGVASLLANDLVTVTLGSAAVVVRSVAAAKGLVGVAQSAFNTATKAGWVLVRGQSVVNTGATATAGSVPYLHATAGSISTTVVTGDAISGMTVTVTGTGAATATVQLTYPVVNTKLG